MCVTKCECNKSFQNLRIFSSSNYFVRIPKLRWFYIIHEFNFYIHNYWTFFFGSSNLMWVFLTREHSQSIICFNFPTSNYLKKLPHRLLWLYWIFSFFLLNYLNKLSHIALKFKLYSSRADASLCFLFNRI